jgi:hypothetical protein
MGEPYWKSDPEEDRGRSTSQDAWPNRIDFGGRRHD